MTPGRRLGALAIFAALVVGAPAPAGAQEAAPTDNPDAEAESPCEPTPQETVGDDGAPGAEPADPDVAPRPPELAFVNGRCIPVAELSALLAGYEGAVAAEAEALVALREQLDVVDELNRQLDAVELALAQVTRREAAAQAETRYAEIRETLAGEELDVVRAELEDQRERLRSQAVAAYVSGRDATSTVEQAVLDAADLNSIGATRAYGRVIIDGQVDQVRLVAELEAAAAVLEAELVDARAHASAVEDRVVEVRAAAEQLRDAQQLLVDDAQLAAEAQAQLVSSIQQRRDEFAGTLGLSSASGGRLGAVLASLSDGTASLADVGTLASPLAQATIVSGFGPRLHPIFNEVRIHTGVDLDSPAGAPIFAVAAGRVVVADVEGGYGMAIAIDHGQGISTLYAHQSAFAVAVGQEVESGDVIGFVGSTGYSTGPHLHFELRLDGKPVDALPFLDLRHVGPLPEATQARTDG